MLLELIKAAALLLALSLLQSLILRHWRSFPTLTHVISGLAFGGICVVGMMTPIEVVPGVIFDPRSVIISMAGLFGGPLVAAITTAIAGGYRAWLGGGGVYVGVAVVLACAALGLFYRHLNRKGWVEIDLPRLLVFGLIVHVVEVLLFTQLPSNAVQKVMETVALPLILTFTPATAFLGLLLKDIDRRIKTELDLAESEARLSLHLRNTPLAAISWDRDFRCTQWNTSAEEIFGYTAEEAAGRRGTELIIPESLRGELDGVFQDLLNHTGGTRYRNKNITKDGRTIVCQWYNTPISDAHGKTIGVVSLAEDITDKERADAEMKLKNALLTTQQEASLDGILSVGPDGKLLGFNQRFLELWNIDQQTAEAGDDHKLLDYVLEQLEDPEDFLAKVRYLYQHRDQSSLDELVLKNGAVLERHSAPMISASGDYYGRMWMFRDITARKQSEELIWRQANFDSLTGLANRQMLRDRLDQEIKRAHRAKQRIALLYLDLDRFKDVNDSLGHALGDLLLIEAAARLRSCVRDCDTVARLGGDEFIILLTGLEDTSGVERTATEVLGLLEQPFKLGEDNAYISTSIGITFYPTDATDVDGLLRYADQAMYAAKDQGRNGFQYFTNALQRQAVERMHVATDLREALSGNQLRLFYQPIVNLKTGSIEKSEALLRWQHPERGLVSPDDFIAIAEETGMISAIGDWVFREAADHSARWRQMYRKNFQVSVNTSPVQYRSGGLDVEEWIRYLQQLDVEGKGIVVEITEGLLLDATQKVTDRLLMFRDAGIQVSLDDFGTGYSSLAYLKKFHIDYLKIDKQFVQNLTPNSDDMVLCEAIIVMAHKLGLKVVAEGIETEQQRQLLCQARCDYGQGYLFSRPVSAEEFERLLAA